MNKINSNTISEDKLPPELWVEIFTRLPAKVLLRLRCVSKSWCSIIENPNFISLHINMFKKLSNSDKHFLLSWETQPSPTLPNVSEITIKLRTMGKFRKKEVILGFCYSDENTSYEHKGYVNGLVLLLTYDKLPPGSALKFVVINPSIRKFVVLPPIPIYPFTRFETIIGFDPLTNDYKVILIFLPLQMMEDTIYDVIFVYELSTGNWRVRNGVKAPGRWYVGPKVFLQGVMYWLSYDECYISYAGEKPVIVGENPDNYTHIVCFDFGSESFGCCIGLPGDRSNACEKVSFPFVLGESFAVFEISSDRTWIWVLQMCDGKKKNSWSLCYDGDSELESFVFFKKEKYAVRNFLYAERIGKFLFNVFGHVKTYDINTCAMKDLEVSSSRYVWDPYVESLLLCKATDGRPLSTCCEGGES